MNESDATPANQLAQLEAKIDEMHKTLKQLKLYFLITMLISIGVVVLPLISLIFVVPILLDSVTAFTESGLL
jgi:hypothetical protein